MSYILIEKLRNTFKHKTKYLLRTEQIEKRIQRRKQQRILTLFDQIEYKEDFCHKKQRNIP